MIPRRAQANRIELEVAPCVRALRCGKGGPFVYAIRPRAGGLTKIGLADDPYRRIRNLQNASPVEMTVVDLVHGGRDVEGAYHDHYFAKRAHGEWFDLGDARNPLGTCPVHIGLFAAIPEVG
jgi:hypothetical protein